MHRKRRVVKKKAKVEEVKTFEEQFCSDTEEDSDDEDSGDEVVAKGDEGEECFELEEEQYSDIDYSDDENIVSDSDSDGESEPESCSSFKSFASRCGSILIEEDISD